ncbi:unnamed protein product [Dovyalis caffra]|uniref:Uncharacterized protein n=1 Tax=Dovyalis caffra TaxID=77055 RepID=A0AAV1QWA1_9ROSI|nr:unnamed protein product [Dovyalis caffra]
MAPLFIYRLSRYQAFENDSTELLALENALQTLGSSDTTATCEVINNFGPKPTTKDDSALERS